MVLVYVCYQHDKHQSAPLLTHILSSRKLSHNCQGSSQSAVSSLQPYSPMADAFSKVKQLIDEIKFIDCRIKAVGEIISVLQQEEQVVSSQIALTIGLYVVLKANR
jgi:hypothetical protein